MYPAQTLRVIVVFLLGLFYFLFVLKTSVYACRLTGYERLRAITGSCREATICAPARTYDLRNPNITVYEGRAKFTYLDIPECEQTVFYNGLTACEAADLTSQPQELSCRVTCNRITAGCGSNCFSGYSRTLADGSTINFQFCSGDGSYCTGASSATPPFSFTPGTSAPEPTDAEFCETWNYGYDCNLGGSCSLHTGAGIGIYSSLAACQDACRIPTVTLTVNNTSSITVDKGEGYVLNWSTRNNPTNCTATGTTGSWSWSLDSPPNNLSSGSQTDSKNQAGSYTYTLTCGNGAGSDSQSVAVTVRQTCPDYTSCSSCTGQPSCGWTGSQCKPGTSCGGPSDGSGICPQWYWFDCLTNQCNAPACQSCSLTCGPGTTLDRNCTTCVSTTCTTALTCAIQSPAVCTSATSGRATVAFTGCAAGYDRVEWFVDGVSKGSNPASSTGGSADLTTLSSNTTYNVSATAWSTRTDPNIDWSQRQTPAVPCGSTTLTTNCSTDTTTPPPPSTLECLLCESNTWNAEGSWVNSGERNCNDYICPTYPHRCDQPPLQQTVVSANRNLSGSTSYRSGEMCFKNDGSGGTTTAPPMSGTITGTFYIRSPGSIIDSLAPNTALNNWDHLRYWIFNTSGGLLCPVNDGSMCLTGVNSLGSYSSGCDSPMPNQTIESSLNRVGLMLYSWPIYFRPIGYYIHQETYVARSSSWCPSAYIDNNARNADGSCWTGLTLCGDNNCCRVDCDTSAEYNCRSTARSTLTPFPRPNLWINGSLNWDNNISTCNPNATVVVDVVFERLPILSGNVCLETPPVNGLKDGTDSNFQGALVNIQGPTSLTRVTSNADINYQVPLTAGSYTITVTGGNSTITSTNGPNNYFSSPALLTINQDTTANFCFNPVGAWLQTTGGSVHSNTRIRMPGGP